MGFGALLAGCSGGATETPTRTETPTTTPGTRTTPGGSRASFAAYLDARQVRIASLSVTDASARLDYEPAGSSADELSAEIGTIAGGFLREVEAGWAVDRLESTILDRAGEAVARWYVRAAWLEAYRSGEISGSELSVRVLESLERVGGTATE